MMGVLFVVFVVAAANPGCLNDRLGSTYRIGFSYPNKRGHLLDRVLIFTLANSIFLLPLLGIAFFRKSSVYVKCFVVLLLLFALDTFLVFLPKLSLLEPLNWNWQGKILEALWPILLFSFYRRFTLKELGLSVAGLDRKTLLIALGAANLAWLPNIYALATGDRVPEEYLNTESILYQLTMPGLAEEIVFRGAFMTIIDRYTGTEWKFLGANVGYGWLITSFLFFGVHLFSVSAAGDLHISDNIGSLSTILFSGLVLGWIRNRTGSIWPCVLAHNVQNSIMFLGSAMLL